MSEWDGVKEGQKKYGSVSNAGFKINHQAINTGDIS